MNFLRGELLEKILMIPAILLAFTFHEYAHAIVSYRLGDKTPKFQGRLTLNPIVHIDILGFIMILLAGFGWAKPVQTNPSAYKNYYKDDLKVSIAGPLANLTVAAVAAVLLGIYGRFVPLLNLSYGLMQIIDSIIFLIIYINVMLFFFNMLPLPGLDGFHVFRDLFPSRFYRVADQLYRYQMIILILFIATPLAGYIIGRPTMMVVKMLLRITNLISL